MIRAGTMRDLIGLLEPTPTTDPRFGNQPGYTQWIQVWANVTPVAGTETFDNSGVQTEITHTIRTRYRPDIDATDRISYRGQTLEIVSVIDPDGRQRELLIQAKQYAGVQ